MSQELLFSDGRRNVRIVLDQPLYLNDDGELWCQLEGCRCDGDKIRGDSRRLSVADLLDILTQHRRGVVEP